MATRRMSVEEVTRDNQEPEVIYHDENDENVFVTPDGIGRYYFDSIEEAREEMLGGDEFATCEYERKDD